MSESCSCERSMPCKGVGSVRVQCLEFRVWGTLVIRVRVQGLGYLGD